MKIEIFVVYFLSVCVFSGCGNALLRIIVSLGSEQQHAALNVSELCLNLTGTTATTHAPAAHFFKDSCSKIKMMATRLATLRSLMASQPPVLAAYIIPTADAHNSEYIAPVDARREWISGFTGSAGTAVVTETRALVWTDGRYYTQFQKETNPELWTLMKQSLPETPTIEKWLASNLSEGAVVGFDPHTMTRDEFTPIETALTKAQMHFVAVQKNLVDEARRQLKDPAPARPFNDILPHTLDYSGKRSGEKIMELRKQLKEKKAAALVITALDEIAYILNLRGSDIEYNPVFFSYLVVTPAAVKLFWNDGKLPSQVKSHLASEGLELEVYCYNCIEEHLKKMATELSEKSATHPSIWLPSDASEAIHRAAAGVATGPKSLSTASLRKIKQQEELTKPLTLISEVSPIALMKLVKNPVELQGFRACHVRDGVAVIRFLHWLQAELHRGARVTEIQAADKLLSFRKEEEDFVGPSFETIAAAGENGAIIHYSPKRDGEQRAITSRDMFLLDSGGQYKDGTTDITRTRHMGSPSEEQRDAFTRVLKGQIMLGTALFPKGVKGNVLDSFARKALWDVGMDYAHGTGHGVGHYLNVHEGPSGVSWRPYPHDPGLKPGQILSNEPGYYKVGEYGIRHEDLVETIAVDRGSDNHPRSSSLKDDFAGRGVVGFHTLTLVPHQRACIDVRMLDHFELAYLNAYHERVLKTVGLKLRECDAQAYDWLVAECAPLHH